jgi:hypothetical protein
MATASFFEISTKAHARFSALPAYNDAMEIVPLDPRGKRPVSSFMPSLHRIPKTPEALALMAAVYPDANAGIRSRREEGALLIIDCDEAGVTDRIERETGRALPTTYTTLTRPQSAPWKMHILFMSTAHSVNAIRKQVTDVTRICGYDLKGCGGYGHVALEGCVRDGETVIAQHDVPIAPVPDWLVNWLVADIAKGRATKRAQKPKPEPEQPSSPRPFAVARDDRNWAIASRIRTWKNTGMSDDDVFDMLVKHIGHYFEDGQQMLTKAYIRKLRAMIGKVPTLGETSYNNLTHRARRRRRNSIPLSTVRERFKSCTPDITPDDARRLFSVKTEADHLRLRRQFHEHGYVYVGPHGSHAGFWSRRPGTLASTSPPSSTKNSLSTKKPSSSIPIESEHARTAPQHKRVTMKTFVEGSGGESGSCGGGSPTILTVTRNGERYA